MIRSNDIDIEKEKFSTFEFKYALVFIYYVMKKLRKERLMVSSELFNAALLKDRIIDMTNKNNISTLYKSKTYEEYFKGLYKSIFEKIEKF